MSEWSKAEIRSLLESTFPGEWGADEAASGELVRVFRGADFVASGVLERAGGASRRLSRAKLNKVELRPGDILLEKSGGSPEQPVGRVSYFDGADGKAAASNFLQTLRPSTKVHGKFLFYLLQNDYWRGRVMPFQQQTTGLINFALKDYLKQEVCIPGSFDVQSRIAEALTEVDELVACCEQRIEKFAALKTGFVQDSLARLKDSPMEPLAQLAVVGGGVTLGRTFAEPGTVEYPYLRVANVQDGHIDLSDVKTLRLPPGVAARALLKAGDVLMNEGGDFDKLGRGAVWRGQVPNCLHQNHVFRVRCDRSKVLPEFLALWAASEYGRKFFMLASKQSTNLASINSTQLKTFPVLRPKLEEQRRVADALGELDSALSEDRQELGKLRKLKMGFSRALFGTGAEGMAGAASL